MRTVAHSVERRFERRDRLLPLNGRKRVEKLLKGVASFQVPDNT
jgi:hypothetical protein